PCARGRGVSSCSPRPCTRGREVGGEGEGHGTPKTPSAPTPLPLSTGGEGRKKAPLPRVEGARGERHSGTPTRGEPHGPHTALPQDARRRGAAHRPGILLADAGRPLSVSQSPVLRQ